MAPVITPAQAGQDLLCCLGLGMLVEGLRAVWPIRGRAAFWPDFFAVGLALVLMQGYAAGSSYAGGLRWYMAAGAAAGAAVMQAALGDAARRAACFMLRALGWPLQLAIKWIFGPAKGRLKRLRGPLRKKNRKTMAKDEKKILQKEHRLLYNYNV